MLLLPFLEEQALFDAINKKIVVDEQKLPNGQPIGGVRIATFVCPSDEHPSGGVPHRFRIRTAQRRVNEDVQDVELRGQPRADQAYQRRDTMLA